MHMQTRRFLAVCGSDESDRNTQDLPCDPLGTWFLTKSLFQSLPVRQYNNFIKTLQWAQLLHKIYDQLSL